MSLAAGGDEVHVISYAMPSRLSTSHERIPNAFVRGFRSLHVEYTAA